MLKFMSMVYVFRFCRSHSIVICEKTSVLYTHLRLSSNQATRTNTATGFEEE